MKIQWDLKYKSLKETLDELAELDGLESLKTNYSRLGQLYALIIANYEEIKKNVIEEPPFQRSDIAIQKEERFVSQLLITSLSILTDTSRLEKMAEVEELEAHQFANNMILLLMIILIIVISYTSLFTANSITKPLAALTKGINIIGQGDLGHRVKVESKDEISALAIAFNHMSNNLNATTTSISKLKREIDERKKVEESLKESEEGFRAIFEQAAVGVVLADWKTGAYIQVNQKYLEIVGYTEEELIELSFEDITHPDDLGADLENLNLLKLGDIPTFTMNKRYIRKNGSTIWVNITVSPMFEYFQTSKQLIVIVEDITERKEAENDIMVKRESLKIINKILRHDLTNDFSVISSALNIYKRNHDANMLNEIGKRVEKGLNTIVRLRSKEAFIDSHLYLKEYDLRKTLDSTINDISDVTINISGSGKVFADEALYSVFENIINNAVVHGKAKAIDISINTRNQFCEIIFSDSGKGIPDNVKEHVFEEGFIHGETGHTGIGLYVVQKTIEGYGGSITVKDNQPVGTSFIINLNKAL